MVLIESAFGTLVGGFPTIPSLILTLGATTLAFLSARGLRARKRWARRVTIFSEWGLIGLASIDLVLTIALASNLPGLVSMVTGFVIPITVLRVMRKTKQLFRQTPVDEVAVDEAAFDEMALSEPIGESIHLPASSDHPVLGTLV